MDVTGMVRRAVLVGSGAIFAGVAVATLVAPRAVAARYAVALDGVDAWSQFRAVYFGFWIGLGVLMMAAAKRQDRTLVGICAVFLLAQSTGRALSLLLEGVPGRLFVGAMLLEAAAGVVLVVTWPRRAANGRA